MLRGQCEYLPYVTCSVDYNVKYLVIRRAAGTFGLIKNLCIFQVQAELPHRFKDQLGYLLAKDGLV